MSGRIEKLYDSINNEEDARVCKDISEDACEEVAGNFFLIIVSRVFTKIGDELSSPKTVLPWLMNYLGAPVYLIGFLVPIRESGSMLPQIFIAGYIRKLALRKWVWVFGSFLQFLAIAGIGLVSIFFTGAMAGWLIMLLLLIFSLSRGLSSVASKDVLGKTIPKSRRGWLTGLSTSAAGVLVMAFALYMLLGHGDKSGIKFYSTLLFIAAAMWLIGALIFANVRERKGETEGGGNAFSTAVKRMRLIREDKPFRNFVIARSLLLCSALTAPFYVVIAQNNLGESINILASFILANGVATTFSAPVWGKLADRSSKKVMVCAAMITASLGIVVFVITSWVPLLRNHFIFYPVAFFILGVAHNGVRLGRKTYIVDMAGGNKRTDYVAVSNTIIGFVLLIAGSISALSTFISPAGIILVLSLFGLAGAWLSFRLPDVSAK